MTANNQVVADEALLAARRPRVLRAPARRRPRCSARAAAPGRGDRRADARARRRCEAARADERRGGRRGGACPRRDRRARRARPPGRRDVAAGGGAVRLADADPERALAALARIEAAGRAALDDIREVIGVLRRAQPTTELAPPPEHAGTLPAAPASPRGTCAATRPRRRSRPPSRGLDAARRCRGLRRDRRRDRSPRRGSRARPWLNVARRSPRSPLRWRSAGARRSPARSRSFAAAWSRALLLTPLVAARHPDRPAPAGPPYTVGAHLPLRRALLGLAICVVGVARARAVRAAGALGLAAFGAGRVVRDRAAPPPSSSALTAALERAGAPTPRARAARSACGSPASCTTRSRTA